MFSQNGRISGRQCFRLYLFDFIGISSLILPTYLARRAGASGVFSIILGVVWGLLYLLFLYEVHGKMETDLGSFLQEYVPTWARAAVQIWLIIHCVAVAGFAAYLFGVMIQYSLLEGESFIIIVAVILAVAAYAVSGGIESRARVYEVLFWFVIVPLAVMIAAAGTQSRAVYFEELWDVGFLEILKGSYMVFLLFAVAFWTLFLARHFRENKVGLSSGVGEIAGSRSTNGRNVNDCSADGRNINSRKANGGNANGRNANSRNANGRNANSKNANGRNANVGNSNDSNADTGTGSVGIYYKKIALAIIIAGIFLVAAYLACLGNFGPAALAEMDFPIITLMSSISIPGNFVKRLDALMIAVWFFMLFAFLNLHIFYGARMMRDLVKEPGSESAEHLRTGSKSGVTEGIFLAAVVIFSGIAALAFYYNAPLEDAFFGYIYYIGTPLFIVMPFVIYWIGRGRRT